MGPNTPVCEGRTTPRFWAPSLRRVWTCGTVPPGVALSPPGRKINNSFNNDGGVDIDDFYEPVSTKSLSPLGPS